MIGRGALGNTFVFEEIRAALEGRACSYTPPTGRTREPPE
jgi:tRNA-dihydrouridine synthase